MANQHPLTADCIGESIKSYLTRHLARTQPDFSEPLHRDMSFDYIGLDSLSRVELVSALANEWSLKLELTAAYDFVTIGALADFIWAELSGATTADGNPPTS